MAQIRTPIVGARPSAATLRIDHEPSLVQEFLNMSQTRTSKQPWSDATKTKAVPEACKPTKAPTTTRKKRSRRVAAKYRSSLISRDSQMFSSRTGHHWMNDFLNLTDLDKIYMRP